MPRVFHFAKPIHPQLSKTVTITTAIDIKQKTTLLSFSSRLRIASMVPNSVALTRTFPRLYSIMSFSSKNLCLSARRTRFLVRGFNSRPYSYFLSSSHGFKELGRRKTGAGQLGFDCFRVSAVSDGGSRGIGGFGGSGGENSGGKGEGADENGGRNDWSLLSWYLALLAKYPVFTKAVTSALLTFIGDLICQLAIDHVPSLDVKRTFLFTLLGLVLVGPTLHFWYLCLSNLVKLPGASGAFLRLLLDQFLFSPIFIGVFLSTLVTLEGRPSQVVPKLQQEWFSAVLANWQLWIPFQFLNFRFVPQQFQVLAANFIALVWNVILSFKAHKEILTK
ncbi:LOW QUALITY PROTEIN: PXMP2/4 family protein 3 [Herrania umbratica]|uniref:LOW QUALITY PROTEIN: PXMP2/4 family protein 3 n=1 Tax=Herrania umbratica TaxID=108875 RepID=A0A6J1BGQ2_9ROSI|nr:LOW QUALITY PROTEIN: PXMP2/4 family protein 3 [Herrania umbratica]